MIINSNNSTSQASSNQATTLPNMSKSVTFGLKSILKQNNNYGQVNSCDQIHAVEEKPCRVYVPLNVVTKPKPK